MWPQIPPLGHPAGAPTPATDGFGSLGSECDLGGNRSSPAHRVNGLASQLVQSPNRHSRPHVGTSNPKSLQLLYRVFVCVSEIDEGLDRSPAGSGRRGAPGAQPEPASCLSATGEQVRGAATDPASRHSHHTNSYSRTIRGRGGEAPREKHPSRSRRTEAFRCSPSGPVSPSALPCRP